MKNGIYRHELKYQINFADYLAMRQRLRAVMKPDEHIRDNGRYIIQSIYFDNYKDKALREKVDGMQKREKFRIRFYNGDLSYIVLEKKLKINSLCMKIDACLKEEECRALLEGQREWMLAHPSELVQELYCKMNSQQLRPRVLVSYIREPYVYSAGNVRVTFDSHIRTSLFHQNFLEQKMWDIDATDDSGSIILEVKYDAYLPEIVQSLLQINGIRQQAFSKYGACRRFG